MQLLDRYLTAVKFWLPKSQRDDIAAELAANLQSEIDDRAASLGRPLAEAEVGALLKQHGSPLLVASRYQNESRTVNFGRQLIGPVVFPFYWIAVKVTLLLLVPGVVASVFLLGDRQSIPGLVQAVLRVVRLSLPALLIVTLVFAVIDWSLRRFHLIEKWTGGWDPGSLPSADSQRKQVRRSSSIAGIIIQSLFILWWMQHSSIPLLVITKAGAQVHFAPVLASLHFPILVIAFICLAQHWISLVEPGWRWLPPLTGMITSAAGLFVLYPVLKTRALVIINDPNGVPISAREMSQIGHALSLGVLGLFVGILIAAIIYAWRLVWIVSQSMPPRPPAPNGKGISLV
jgi:hypothetical protein